METRVDIIVGGVQKGGTTSFHAHLAEHPDLMPPTRKEIHFFDDESVDWRAPDYGRLHAFFPDYDGARKPFDVTPIYLFWPPSFVRIRAYNPRAKLIFLFRDPIERAWSHWCMEHARGADNMPFADAIRDGRRRLDNLSPTEQPWRVYSYVERGYYAEQVLRLFNYFPREQILFLRSDDLNKRTASTLQRVSDFLGIAPFSNSEPKRERERTGKVVKR